LACINRGRMFQLNYSKCLINVTGRLSHSPFKCLMRYRTSRIILGEFGQMQRSETPRGGRSSRTQVGTNVFVPAIASYISSRLSSV
jgi:hypothetical protein